jgi:hypothetical protein
MTSTTRRGVVADTFHEKILMSTTTSRDHKAHLKKLQATATNLCTRMTSHLELLPGYRSCYRCFDVFCRCRTVRICVQKEVFHNQQMKTWDTRMTTLEGKFVINWKFIDWLIRLMMRSSPDVDTDEVIHTAVLKTLSDTDHVKHLASVTWILRVPSPRKSLPFAGRKRNRQLHVGSRL